MTLPHVDIPGQSWGDDEFVRDLTGPFPPEEIRWTVAATRNKNTPQLMELWAAYVDADSIRRRLDAVAQPGCWGVDFEPLGADKAMLCRLTIRGVIRADVGEPGDQARMPWKAAATDAFKRAAAQFGIGRYLKKQTQWRKPNSGSPSPRQGPPQPASAPPQPPQPRPPSTTPPRRPQPPPVPPEASSDFAALMAAHDIGPGKAATLIGAMAGSTPDEAIRLYVASLPGTEEEKWKKARDNLSGALADEAMAG